MACEKVPNQGSDLGSVLLECEVAGVEQVNFRFGSVALKGGRSGR
jgi:hypothetical protein